MQALPLEQKPWAYARQTVAEAGSCLCRYLQSFFEHSPCKAAQLWQISRFLSNLYTHTTVLGEKRVVPSSLSWSSPCSAMMFRCKAPSLAGDNTATDTDDRPSNGSCKVA